MALDVYYRRDGRGIEGVGSVVAVCERAWACERGRVCVCVWVRVRVRVLGLQRLF